MQLASGMTRTEMARRSEADPGPGSTARSSIPFAAARRWHPWQQLPGALAIAAGVALWVVVFAAVAGPLGASLP
jgi:hypothetical protein